MSLGVIRISTSIHGPDWTFQGGSADDPGAGASGGFSDVVTINSPGLSGTTGVAHMTAYYDGGLSASGYAASTSGNPLPVRYYAKAIVGLMSGTVRSDTGLMGVDSTIGTGLLVPSGELSIDVPFTFGQSFNIDLGMDLFVGIRAPNLTDGTGVVGGFSASADFGNTVSWGGITSVTPDGGSALSSGDWSASADSGINWALPAAVPEPGSLALLTLGGLTIFAKRRNATL